MERVYSRIWTVPEAISYDGNNYAMRPCIFINYIVGLVDRVFANSPADRGSILHRVLKKTKNMVHDASLLTTIEEQSSERSTILLDTFV